MADAGAYDDRVAAYYDTWVAGGSGDAAAAVAFLQDIAGQGGAALELGIGTGRVAVPLAAAGVRVIGIDTSAAMVARLRDKPGGADLQVVIGDFAEVPVEGRFRLIYAVLNTFFSLQSQADQVRCFRNVAAHLAAGGAFVIEAFVPDPGMFDRGQRVSATRVEADRVQLSASLHDGVSQHLTTQHVMIGREGITLLPMRLRYAWPSELDLMAELAGLQLLGRFADWTRAAFTSTSAGHVSVYTGCGV